MRCSALLVTLLPGAALALDCSKYEELNREWIVQESIPSPPGVLHRAVYFNPCEPVNNSECLADDHLCYIETISQKDNEAVVALKSFGSKKAGAKEKVATPSEDHPFITYHGAFWGETRLLAGVFLECSDRDDESNGYFVETHQGIDLHVRHPSVCGKGKKGSSSGSGGWGFFSWLFFLLVLAGVGYALLTVYVNYAQSRGNLPFAADIGDVLRDLPYLLRDLLRKINVFNRRSTTSGYAAL